MVGILESQFIGHFSYRLAFIQFFLSQRNHIFPDIVSCRLSGLALYFTTEIVCRHTQRFGTFLHSRNAGYGTIVVPTVKKSPELFGHPCLWQSDSFILPTI